MKRTNLKFLKALTLALVSSVVLFSSCKDENDDGNTEKPNYVFSVSDADKSITAEAIGGEQIVIVSSTKNKSNVAFSVVSAPEWVPATVEMTGLKIVFVENTAKTPREESKIVLKQAETDTQLEITVNQKGVASSLTLASTYATARCKVLLIEPAILGYDKSPTYEWTCKKSGAVEAATVVGTEKNFPFIKLETGDYELSLKIADGNTGETQSTTVSVTTEPVAYSPFISSVLEYKPAPGPKLHGLGGWPSLAFSLTDTYSTALEKVNGHLAGKDFSEMNQGVNLGGFGGYIVFRFDHTVMNVSGYRDFRVASAMAKTAYPSPGIVMVAFDKNGNGAPDGDEWYEIAGSEYGKTTSQSGITVTYTRPTTITENGSVDNSEYMKWEQSNQESGYIGVSPMGGTAGVPIWPFWLREAGQTTIVSSGLTLLPGNTPMNGMYPGTTVYYTYGYANSSTPKDEDNSSIDIDWAVDKDGKSVHLPGIDFVKVYTATNQNFGSFYGNAYMSINAAYDLHLLDKKIPTIAK